MAQELARQIGSHADFNLSLLTAISTDQGAAGGGDAFTRLQTQKQQEGGPRDSRITGPIKAKLPALRPLTPPSTIEGLVVPAHPNQQARMAMLLNQQPGKLLLTDIQAITTVSPSLSWQFLHFVYGMADGVV